MKNLLLVTLILFGLAVTGCGKQEATAPVIADSKPQTPVTLATATPTPSPTATPTPIALTVYSSTVVLYYVNGVTPGPDGTGNCVVYNSNTYCWDDGLKGAVGDADSFFATGAATWSSNALTLCDGACLTDTFATPILMDTDVNNYLAGNAPNANRLPSSIFANGVQTQASCNLNGAVLDCGSFSIDTAQTPL